MDLLESDKFTSHVGNAKSLLIFPAASCLLALAPFLVFLLPTNDVIPTTTTGDYSRFQLPVREFSRNEMLAGRFPAWIPDVGCGMPLHALQQASLTYPLVTPFVLLLGANSGIKFAIFIHSLGLFLGQYRLSRRLGISRIGGSLAGIIIVQSGFMTSHLMAGHITMIFAFCWFPWLVWSILRMGERIDTRSTAVVALIASMIVLTGHPHMAYFALLIGLATAIGVLLFGRGAKHGRSFLVLLLAGGVVASLLSMVQIAPTMELLHDGIGISERRNEDFSSAFSVSPIGLLRFLVPNITGNPFRGDMVFETNDFFHEGAAYLGLATLLLSLFALTRQNRKAWEYFVPVIFLVCVLYSLGDRTPIHCVIDSLVPGLSTFRCPGRIFCTCTVLLPLLAARGMDAIIEQVPSAKGLSMLAVLSILFFAGNSVCLYVTGFLNWPIPPGFWEFVAKNSLPEIEIEIQILVVTTGALFLCHQLSSGNRRTFASGLVVAVVLLDLGYGNASFIRLKSEPKIEVPSHVFAVTQNGRFCDHTDGNSWKLQLRYSQMTSTAIYDRIHMVGTNDGGIFPYAVQRLHNAIDEKPLEILSLASCAFVVNDKFDWTELPNTLDRVRFISLPQKFQTFDPIETASLRNWIDSPEFAYEIANDNSVELDVLVEAPCDGVVAIADTHYPGWRCFVDKAEVEILPLHGVFRAVQVMRGSHRVTFKYDPLSLRLGALLSVFGAACAVVGIVFNYSL